MRRILKFKVSVQNTGVSPVNLITIQVKVHFKNEQTGLSAVSTHSAVKISRKRKGDYNIRLYLLCIQSTERQTVFTHTLHSVWPQYVMWNLFVLAQGNFQNRSYFKTFLGLWNTIQNCSEFEFTNKDTSDTTAHLFYCGI